MNLSRKTSFSRLTLGMLAILLTFGCSKATEPGISQGNFSATLDESLSAQYICSNLSGEIVVDDGTPAEGAPVPLDPPDCVNGTIGGTVTGLSAGDHTFTLNFYVFYLSAQVLVASQTTPLITIVVGNNPDVNFTLVPMTFPDDDLDGASNLDEVNAGTDPYSSLGVFSKTVVLPTAGGDWSNIFWTSPNRNQLLVLAADMGGSGMIDSMSFRLAGAEPGNNCPDVTINLVHTDLSDLTNTFDSNHGNKGSLVTVLANAMVSIPAGIAGDYFDIPFSQPFDYNGVDNLIVETRSEGCNSLTEVQAGAAAVSYTAGIFALGSSTATGSTWIYLPHMKFGFTGGEDTIRYGAPGNNICPFWPASGCEKIQFLFSSTDINGTGPITGLGMLVGTLTTAQTYTVTVQLGHTALGTLTTNFASNFSDTPVVVANGINFEIPAGVPVGSYVWLPFPNAYFLYNGTDNMIVDVDVTAGTGTFGWGHSSGSGRAGGSTGSATATFVDAISPHVKFRFYGGTIDTIIGTGGSDASRTFNTSGTGGIEHYLYRASELGTGGAVTKMACRMATATSTATVYTNFEVVLGHTSLTALTNTFASNMIDATTVFSGTFSLPAGLIRGDWIEIPFSTPFIYDGTRNLVVQTVSDAGATAHGCSVLFDGARYPARRLSSADRSSATGSNFDHLRDQQLWIVR